MMDDRAFALIVARFDRMESRMDRLESKIDKLMAFRSYMSGVAAVFGIIGAWVHSLIKGY